MPRIDKSLKKPIKRKVKRVKKSTAVRVSNNKKPTKTLTKKLKHSVAYYDCCLAQTKKGLKGVKITQICHHCKHNSQKYAIAKAQDREVEKQKIANA
jgi:hypothetical protein